MKKYLSLLIAASIILCGCVYHPPVFQGNVLTPEKVQQIHTGMTSEEVVAKLGTPVLKNAYETNQITYIYTSQKASKQMEIKKLEIDFTNNRVATVRTWL
ncbi:MAG: outer membrane protein assembly factor BamE [Coxiellaceae bacterium]|nr:outer membrane protein assembly factor BamE [Coxiellaceae bacterium]